MTDSNHLAFEASKEIVNNFLLKTKLLKPQTLRNLSWFMIAIALFVLTYGVLSINGAIFVIASITASIVIVFAIVIRRKSFPRNSTKTLPRLKYYLVPMFIGLAIYIIISIGPGLYADLPLPNPYVNHQYGFTITYPQGWHGRENYYVRTITHEDNYTAIVVFYNGKGSMTISKWPLNNQTFDGFVTSKVAHFQSLAPGKYNYVLQSPNQTQVNGYPAYVGTSHFTDTKGNTTNYWYYIADGSSAFDTTLACLDANCHSLVDEFEHSVNSIKFDS